MKTIKDLKNYVKQNSRIVLKDCIDTECFHYSEWAIIQDMKKQVKKKSKAIYKEFRDNNFIKVSNRDIFIKLFFINSFNRTLFN